MIPPFLAGLAAVAAALLVWAVETAAVLVVKLLQWAKAFEDFVKVQVLPALPGWLHQIDLKLIEWSVSARDAIYDKTQEIGAHIVAGIKKGVEDAWDEFKHWVHDKIMEIPEAICTALGIHSPSTVMAELVGKPIIAGIAQGIIDAMPELNWATTDIAKAFLAPLQKVADEAHKIIADSLQFATTNARTMVTSFDQMVAIAQQAQDAKDKAATNLAAAQAALDKAKSDGDAAVAAAQASVDQANKLLAGAKTPDEIAAAQAAIDQANADLQKARDDANKAIADASTAFSDANTAYTAANTQFNIAMATQQQARAALADAQAQVAVISQTDAQAGAEYLTLRTNQIYELAGLEQQQQDAQAAGNTALADQLGQKIDLVKQAQAAELAQFQQHADDLAKQQADELKQMTAMGAADGTTAGNAIVQGMINGINASTGALRAAMDAVIQAAIEAAMAKLQAASPSKVFANIGGFMSEGMAIGIEAKAMLLADATSRVAQGAVTTANNTITNYNLNANYRHQGEQSLRDDVVMLSMLKGRK